jgi:hypothetical protein
MTCRTPIRTRVVVSLLSVSLMVLCACGADYQQRRHAPPETLMPTRLAAGQVFMVDVANHRLTAYDLRAKRVLAEDRRPQTFAYTFPQGPASIVAVGSSTGGNFNIIDLRRKALDPIAVVRSKAAFPLVFAGPVELFALVAYAANGLLASASVARFDGHRMHELARDYR